MKEAWTIGNDTYLLRTVIDNLVLSAPKPNSNQVATFATCFCMAYAVVRSSVVGSAGCSPTVGMKNTPFKAVEAPGFRASAKTGNLHTTYFPKHLGPQKMIRVEDPMPP